MKTYLILLATAVVVFFGIEGLRASQLISATPFQIEIIVFFLILTGVIIRNIKNRAGDAMEKTRFYLLSIVVKLIAALGFIVTLFVIDGEHVSANAMVFLISYFAFTAVEIVLIRTK